MDDGRMWSGIIAGVIFLLLKAFITASETAVIEVNDSKVKKLAETSKKGERLLKLISKPNRLLVSISILKSLTTIIVAFVATITFFEPLDKYFFKLIDNKYLSDFITILTLIVGLVIVIVTISSTIPKKLARKNTEKFPYAVAGILNAFIILITPMEKIIAFFTFILSKILGLSTNEQKETVTEEEILMIVDAVNETGAIEESQKEMINNIFEFDDLTVYDVMTHRTKVVAVEKNTSIKELVSIAIEEGFSRIPVYENSIDNVIGVVYIKDLLQLIGSDVPENICINEYIRDILYIPRTNLCGTLFNEFTNNKAHIAVVVDEYGGTSGIITLEDILESIVGNIQDEYDDEDAEIITVNENEFEVLGNANPEEVMELLSLELEEDHDYDTIGGFVIDLLGHIPKENEHPQITYKNFVFTVLEADENKIEKLNIKIIDEIIEE